MNFEGHQTFDQKLKTFLLFSCFASNMFETGKRNTLAKRLVSIVSSGFDQTCFNRLATHFKIRMFGHKQCLMVFGRQTFLVMENVWRPNTIKHCLVGKHFTVRTPW